MKHAGGSPAGHERTSVRAGGVKCARPDLDLLSLGYSACVPNGLLPLQLTRSQVSTNCHVFLSFSLFCSLFLSLAHISGALLCGHIGVTIQVISLPLIAYFTSDFPAVIRVLKSAYSLKSFSCDPKRLAAHKVECLHRFLSRVLFLLLPKYF